jgi:DNA-binding transcriptional MocR family regulator
MSTVSKKSINLLRGWPNHALLPREQLLKSSAAALSDASIANAGLEYAPDRGHPALLDALGGWLGRFYGFGSSPEATSEASKRLCITGGASQNIACILAGFSDPVYTRHVWMVSPTYFLACRMIEDAGFTGRIRAIKEDDEGIDVDALERFLVEAEKEATKKGITKPVCSK